MEKPHSFHIPVMGLGFTLDSPVKLAHYGIDSAVALADDSLIEKMREFYCRKFNFPFRPISSHEFDYRCERIKEYLNLLDEIVKKKFEELKKSALEKGSELEKFIDMLPEMSDIKKSFQKLTHAHYDVGKVWKWVKENLTPGSIQVNIMTKLDKVNFRKGEKLPVEFNDAHAALRGFASSNLQSGVILSAGMNPLLYGYMEQFPDFYPDRQGHFHKEIILKVSDYRSALIQGKYLAKKGLWVSEYRVESGLNCGGHAFATDGYLMGPVLEEFRENRQLLTKTIFEIFCQALIGKQMVVPESPCEIRITAQGGVGTSEEHQLLLEHYGVDSVGWGTPFLLVPEATSVDEATMKLLAEAKEEDLYLSNVSPLGVPFNNIRNNTKDIEKMERVKSGIPGSPCTKQFLKLYKDKEGNQICMASREYQKEKLMEAEATITQPAELKKAKQNIFDKVCLCVGLGTSALITNGISYKSEGKAVSICPGPNIAWFSKIFSLNEMVGHIYGKNNVISRNDRPHMFINELNMYVEYFRNKISENKTIENQRVTAQLKVFRENLIQGIGYYKNLFNRFRGKYNFNVEQFNEQLDAIATDLQSIQMLHVPD
jgi:hypothetical protein